MRRPLLRVTAGAVALASAILLALLGRAVLATPETPAAVGASWPANVQVETGRTLSERTAARLLATDRAAGYVELVDTYRRLTEVPALAGAATNPLRLARLISGLQSDQERARAHLMVGAIFALPAGDGSVTFDLVRGAGQGRLLDQAVEEFRAAAALEEQNEDAKYDLELILKSEAQRLRRSQVPPKKGEKEKQRQAKQARNRARDRSARTDIQQRSADIYADGSGY